MADTSPQKEEEEVKNSFNESAANVENVNILNETNVKEEAIVDNSEEYIPEPVEAERPPSPPISHHSREAEEEVLPPSSSNQHQPISPDSKPEQPTDSQQNQNGDASAEANEQKKSADDNDQKEDDSQASPDHSDNIYDERKPDDIEPEIKKVILQGYTQEGPAKENNVVEISHATQQPSPSENKPTTKSVIEKQAASSPSKIVAPTQRAPSSQQRTPLVKDVKQTPNTTAKKPTTPLRSTTTADKKPTPLSQTPKTIPSKPSAPLRPPPTQRRTPSATTRRTPSSNPRATPKTPATAPPRAMSAVRASTGKAENAAYKTPISNKKYENIQGKINASSNHKPGGGNVKIFHEKPKFNVSSKIGSLSNATHTPGGGQVRIESRKLNFKENAKPKIDDKAEIQSHVEKKIPTQKLEWKASSKVGSLQNANHKPAGGDVKIFSQKVKVEAAQSKVGSLDNANHKPTGGNVNIKDYKVAGKSNSSSNSVTSHSTSNSRRSSATRARMPGSRDPMTPEEALGRN